MDNREKVVAARLNGHEYKNLKECCARQHVKVSEGIRSAIRNWTNDQPDENLKDQGGNKR